MAVMHRRSFMLAAGAPLVGCALGMQRRSRGDSPSRHTRLYPICVDNRWGYIDGRGEIRIEPRFVWAKDFAEGRAIVGVRSTEAIIDERGRTIYESPEYWSPFDPFSEGRVEVMQVFPDGGLSKFGFLDAQGKVVVEPQYAKVMSFSEGLAAVCIVDQQSSNSPEDSQPPRAWGFIDKTGKVTIEPQPQSRVVWSFSEGLAVVYTGGQQVYIDKTGAIAIRLDEYVEDPTQDWCLARSFSEGLASVKTSIWEGTIAGFIDHTGRFAIKPQYQWAGDFHEGLAPVGAQDKRGFCDRKGRVIGERLFDGSRRFSQGVAAVRLGKHWQYVDKEMNVVIDSARKGRKVFGPLNDAEDFREGLARVHVGGHFVHHSGAHSAYWKGGAWYYVDRTGKIVHRVRKDEENGPGYGKELRYHR